MFAAWLNRMLLFEGGKFQEKTEGESIPKIVVVCGWWRLWEETRSCYNVKMFIWLVMLLEKKEFMLIKRLHTKHFHII